MYLSITKPGTKWMQIIAEHVHSVLSAILLKCFSVDYTYFAVDAVVRVDIKIGHFSFTSPITFSNEKFSNSSPLLMSF